MHPERLIRIVIGKPLPNGQIVDEEVIMPEREYKNMLSGSQLPTQRTIKNSLFKNRVNCDSTLDNSAEALLDRRTGSLFSWREDDSSDDERLLNLSQNQK